MQTSFIKTFMRNKQLFILSLPGVLFLFIFSYMPLYGLLLPFKDYKIGLGFWDSPWVGLDNFKYLFTQDAFRITRNTVGYNLAFIVVLLIVAVAFALMLNEMRRTSVKFYQTVLFLPYFLSFTVVSYVFLALFDMQNGFVNAILHMFGKEAVLWYNDAKYWPPLLVFTYVWKNAGYFTIIYYTGLLGINDEYYEAARVDGANKWHQIKDISIPLLKPLIVIMVMTQVGKIFVGNFDMFYQIPRDTTLLYPTTDVIDTYVFRSLKSLGDIGMASAAGVYQSVVGLVLVIFVNWLIRKFDSENSVF
ncbi:ABC transporter permease [Paenibacillus aceris]|nr:ABC transporter permease subunit [Paenibacillus aceris]NHW35996.1 sugar ABC transporter permease [Paenibacillus aceris]